MPVQIQRNDHILGSGYGSAIEIDIIRQRGIDQQLHSLAILCRVQRCDEVRIVRPFVCVSLDSCDHLLIALIAAIVVARIRQVVRAGLAANLALAGLVTALMRAGLLAD